VKSVVSVLYFPIPQENPAGITTDYTDCYPWYPLEIEHETSVVSVKSVVAFILLDISARIFFQRHHFALLTVSLEKHRY